MPLIIITKIIVMLLAFYGMATALDDMGLRDAVTRGNPFIVGPVFIGFIWAVIVIFGED